MKVIRPVLNFIKKESIFCIAAILAVASCFIVKPTAAYAEYIDFRVLAILLCLMLVVAVLQKIGIFEKIMRGITSRIHSARLLRLVLVLVCFFSSMVITNDVALITFVPFTIMLLNRMDRRGDMIYVVSLQTIAANLGSMATPIGNPQNVYLYSAYNMTMGEFMGTVWLYTLVSLVILCILSIIPKDARTETVEVETTSQKYPVWKYILLVAMFVISILCVLRVVDFWVMLIVVLAGTIIWDYKLLAKADYMLLATFVAFFVLVGNIEQIPQVNNLVGKLISKDLTIASVAISQVISNVPAAVLLSGFTNDGASLLAGVNIGGLGTLIASMASLISYKAYASEKNSKKGKYMLVFTGLNIVFLIVMLALFYFVGA